MAQNTRNDITVGSNVVTPRGERGRVIAIRPGYFDASETEAVVAIEQFTVPHVWNLSELRSESESR